MAEGEAQNVIFSHDADEFLAVHDRQLREARIS